MPATVIMPALELAQETGKVLRWLKSAGDTVVKGEPIVEIETDKVTVEVEAPASGVLRDVTAREGDVVAVGKTIALIFAAGEAPGEGGAKASPLARKLAAEHGVDLARVHTSSGRIEKADVLAHVERRSAAGDGVAVRLLAASPKARRLAAERGVDLAAVKGSGPGGAVLVGDVPAARAATGPTLGNVWRIMAERMTASWTTAPHFYLVREVDVSGVKTWRERASSQSGARITYTDVLVRLVAAALVRHPRVNVAWKDGAIFQHGGVDIGLAVAIEDGLVVPVLRGADALTLAEIAARREDLVGRAQTGKLRPADIQGGGFTISNLGMYGVDAFNAIVNPPQAAILAVGRIVDRAVVVDGQVAVRPTLVLTLSCDHRALDGARAAQFLGTLADLVEEPLALLA
ncbi:MAG TPA: dihydrolipoamide acetyltransferase family protein [Methylomirabilota bacterium]|jgi:pyruvate dehydrogenase E2 component (dihydrolipoamide acetyltransferase)